MEKREAWEKVNDLEYPPLQFPLVPTDGRASTSISEAAKKMQEIALKIPVGVTRRRMMRILTSRNIMLLTWWRVTRAETTRVMS